MMLSLLVTYIMLFHLAKYCNGYDCLNLVNDCGAKPNTLIDNTFTFYSCQDKLKKPNGGCVTVPNGTYKVFNVILNTSNIIYYIDSSVTFIPYTSNDIHNKSYPVFFIGSTTSFIKNISIIGSPDKKFLIDLSNVTFTPWNVRGIQLFGIDGFTLSNINIKNNIPFGTAKAAIGFDGNNVNNSNGNFMRYHAKNGKVINITSSGQPYGYGLSQLQSAENIQFENLDGTGGITLRLETDAALNGYLNNITGNNIICRNGHAAFSSTPHTNKNGYFEMHNLATYSCYVGYVYAFGYAQDNKTAGWFANGSIVNNVKSYYGTQAQIALNDTGPSCGPCGIPNNKDVQNYIVNISDLQSFDFPSPKDRNDGCPQWNQHYYPPLCPWDNSSFVF